MGYFTESRIHHGDSLKFLGECPPECVDLVFADPPFNIGYVYDNYDDARKYDDYVKWTRDWMAACQRVLQPAGSFYVAIGDEYAAEVRVVGRTLGLHLRNWIIWHYAFGQNMRTRFSLSHTHIFFFTKHEKDCTFNRDAVSFPSARHTEYSDRRAHPTGRVPNDVWDEFPRLCGTFAEREGWHGCQMPESILMRIIRASSNPGDVVLDPFVGSGTTVSAAVRLGRIGIGIDQSAEYAREAERRLGEARRVLEEERAAAVQPGWTPLQREFLRQLYRETATPRANLVINDVAMQCFAHCLEQRTGRPRPVDEIIAELNRLDAANDLPRFKNDREFAPKQRNKDNHTGDRKLAKSWYAGVPRGRRSPKAAEEIGSLLGLPVGDAAESANGVNGGAE